MPFCDYRDDSSTVRDVLARQATRYAPLEHFTEDLMRGPSPFSVAERELIAAFVSGTNACQFCYGAHVAGATAFGVAPGLIESLIEDIDGTAAVDARLKPVLHFVRKLTMAPARVTRGDADAVYAAGWSEDALSVSFNGVHGSADSGQGDTRAGDKETIYDLIVGWDPSEEFSAYINADYIDSENSSAAGEFDGYGVAMAGRYALSERMGVAIP